VETQYALWSNDRVTAAVGLAYSPGRWITAVNYKMALSGVTSKAWMCFIRLNLAYQLNERMHVILKVARYQLAFNKVNNVPVGLQYHF
jgi:hypothetical protein